MKGARRWLFPSRGNCCAEGNDPLVTGRKLPTEPGVPEGPAEAMKTEPNRWPRRTPASQKAEPD